MLCSRCGIPNRTYAKQCLRCGQPLVKDAAQRGGSPRGSARKPRRTAPAPARPQPNSMIPTAPLSTTKAGNWEAPPASEPDPALPRFPTPAHLLSPLREPRRPKATKTQPVTTQPPLEPWEEIIRATLIDAAKQTADEGPPSPPKEGRAPPKQHQPTPGPQELSPQAAQPQTPSPTAKRLATDPKRKEPTRHPHAPRPRAHQEPPAPKAAPAWTDSAPPSFLMRKPSPPSPKPGAALQEPKRQAQKKAPAPGQAKPVQTAPAVPPKLPTRKPTKPKPQSPAGRHTTPPSTPAPSSTQPKTAPQNPAGVAPKLAKAKPAPEGPSAPHPTSPKLHTHELENARTLPRKHQEPAKPSARSKPSIHEPPTARQGTNDRPGSTKIRGDEPTRIRPQGPIQPDLSATTMPGHEPTRIRPQQVSLPDPGVTKTPGHEPTKIRPQETPPSEPAPPTDPKRKKTEDQNQTPEDSLLRNPPVRLPGSPVDHPSETQRHEPPTERARPVQPDSPAPPAEHEHALRPMETVSPRLLENAQASGPSGQSREATELETQRYFRLSSRARRFVAIVIDGSLILALIVGIISIGALGERAKASLTTNPDILVDLALEGVLWIPCLGLLLLAGVSTAASHALVGRTLGKMAVGIELVAYHSGEKPGPGRSAVRALLAVLGTALGGAGYLWLIVDPKARTLHDVCSGTAAVVSSSQREVVAPKVSSDGFV